MEATYRNDRTVTSGSDHFVSEASASRVVYAGSTLVSVQPHISMTWQADESSVAVVNSPIASQVKPHRIELHLT
jgi:hypothetical protein